MPVPEEIRNVPRPVNTIVKAYGKNKDKYIVIARKPSIRRSDGKYRPVNSGTIGHIENGKFVPITSKPLQNVSMETTDYKTFGCYALCDLVFSDVLEELRTVYSYDDALKIYIIAIIRVCRPGIKDHRLDFEYDSSYLSELYPGVALCKNTVCTFQTDLGRTCSKIRQFMKQRLANVKIDHHLIIDGTLKTDDSTVNELSAFSRKARLKNRKDISILYAYDYESKEPICSECFPGNEIDSTSYKEFLEDNSIKKGIVIVDKGFSIDKVRDYYKKHPDLHYINPLKRDDSRIKTYNMYEFDDQLDISSDGPSAKDGVIYCKKVSYTVDGQKRWLYSFKDVYRAMQEEESWAKEFHKLPKAEREKLDFAKELEKKRPAFGTITMESDLDMPPEDCYRCYDSRWSIELMMRCYKFACDFDTTDNHSDYSIMGEEFINFFSVLLTYRLENLFENNPKLKGESFTDIMDDLRRVKKIRMENDEWKFSHILDKYKTLMQETGLLPKPEPKKRGRPRIKPEPDPNQPKRQRGRPKGSKNKPKSDPVGQSA